MFPLLDGLDPQQRRAAEFDGPRLRILAGAGTGKTTTLTARVACLVKSGIPAERLMLLTFTRRAARQMVDRTRVSLQQMDPNTRTPGRILGGTFHSVAHMTLRRHASSLGLEAGYSVLDSSDAADVIDMVRSELQRNGQLITSVRRFPRKGGLLELYSRSVNTQLPLSEVIERTAPWCAPDMELIAEICRGYVACKRSLSLLDFDDLLLYWRAAALDERLGPRLSAEVDHICVDEYQDVNALQVDLLRALARSEKGLTVVGDDSQAIYGFRGASPDYLLDIEDDFPTIHTIALGTNFRSTQPILDVANALSDGAPRGFVTRLHSLSEGGEPPLLINCADEDAQVRAVCENVLEHREEGIPLKEQAVLVRASHHSDQLELELSRRSIPYVKYGGLRFLEAAHVKDLICLFRLADNPRDQLSWFRLLQMLDGVGPVRARRAIDVLGVDRPGTSLEVLLRWPLAAEELPRSARQSATSLVEALVRKEDESPLSQAERLRTAIGPLIEQTYENGTARLADLDALVAAACDSERLSDVAAELTLEPPASTGELAGDPLIDEDWLVISTVHSAKGLEWDVVHVINAADGNFPSDMALSSREGLEEERRLFYVALTRARRHLNVYVPLRFHFNPRGRDDGHTIAQQSRFLSTAVRSNFSVVERSNFARVPSATVDVASVVDLSLDGLWQ